MRAISESDVADQRRLAALRHALGEAVLAALDDPRVVEVMVNPDGRLILDRHGEGRSDTGAVLSAAARDRVVRLVADFAGEGVGRDRPRLSGLLPGGERFQAIMPPLASAATFSIRKTSPVVWTIDDYVRDGVMAPRQAAAIREAAESRLNILVSGGTGSGKTTLANAILAEPSFARDRVFLIEDVAELQCSARDVVAVLTRGPPASVGVADLVRDALRMRPDRIIIGEMRDGAAALETLKSWNTGHPGGLSTLHANSAEDAPRRLEDLIAEVTARTPRRLIAQSVDRIIHISRGRTGRKIDAVLGVACLDEGDIALQTIA